MPRLDGGGGGDALLEAVAKDAGTQEFKASDGAVSGDRARARAGAEAAVTSLMEILGHDVLSPGVADTPRRVSRAVGRALARAYDTLIESAAPARCAIFNEEVAHESDANAAPIVSVRGVGVSLWTAIEGLPTPFTLSLAYVPANGRIVGLSKVARVASALALRPWETPSAYADAVCQAMHDATHATGTAVWLRRDPDDDGALWRSGVGQLQTPDHGAPSGCRFDELAVLAPDSARCTATVAPACEAEYDDDEDADPRDARAALAAVDKLLLACLPPPPSPLPSRVGAGTPPPATSRGRTCSASSADTMTGVAEGASVAPPAAATVEVEVRVRRLAHAYVDALLRRTRGYVLPASPPKPTRCAAATHVQPAWAAMHGGRACVVRNLRVESLCEHHMLPFQGSAVVGVWACEGAGPLPAKRRRGGDDTWSAALPSHAEVAWVCLRRSHRLQVQERLGFEIAGDIASRVSSLLGAGCAVHVAVVLACTHGCMLSRGVEQRGSLTSSVSWRSAGASEVPADVRAQLLAALHE